MKTSGFCATLLQNRPSLETEPLIGDSPRTAEANSGDPFESPRETEQEQQRQKPLPLYLAIPSLVLGFPLVAMLTCVLAYGVLLFVGSILIGDFTELNSAVRSNWLPTILCVVGIPLFISGYRGVGRKPHRPLRLLPLTERVPARRLWIRAIGGLLCLYGGLLCFLCGLLLLHFLLGQSEPVQLGQLITAAINVPVNAAVFHVGRAWMSNRATPKAAAWFALIAHLAFFVIILYRIVARSF